MWDHGLLFFLPDYYWISYEMKHCLISLTAFSTCLSPKANRFYTLLKLNIIKCYETDKESGSLWHRLVEVRAKATCWSITVGSQGRETSIFNNLLLIFPFSDFKVHHIARLLTSDMESRATPFGQWKENTSGTERGKRNVLVNNVFDVVMHALVRPSFVWLYVKGHLCKTQIFEHRC